jgi:hypothetical protein
VEQKEQKGEVGDEKRIIPESLDSDQEVTVANSTCYQQPHNKSSWENGTLAYGEPRGTSVSEAVEMA